MADLNYDSIAESYGEDWCGLRGQSRDLVVNQVAGHFERIETSLDCAIGHGEFWTDLAQQTPVVACVGNDLSPEMLVAAQARLEGTHFEGVTGDALTLSERLAGKTFDLVVSHLLYDYCA
ncbi:MAG: class I SAM-dependent methyltransferase, partial [Myxococcota bacterium]|nr:class I SAM-dependent methyltransferase [Myxococcota bacterium]